jgi:glycosyltransferase involved in cell wall biosynthesis
MSENPLVTVIIATYNKKSTLRHAIDSVLWQKLEDFELWVMGDGCTDGSDELVESYTDPRVNWYNFPENTGDQSEPTNEALRRSKGKYIAYLNHDDIWMPNHLEYLVKTIEEQDADFAFSIMEWVYDENDPIPGNVTQPVVPHYPDSPFPPEATQTMHKREIIDEIGYWRRPDEVYTFPRADYFRRAQFIGKKFVLAPMVTAIKFFVYGKDYSQATTQPVIMEKIKNDPEFLVKEMSKMLAFAWHENEKPVSFRRFKNGLSYGIKRMMVKRKIDPALIKPWVRRGKRMRDWRTAFGLEPRWLKKK